MRSPLPALQAFSRDAFETKQHADNADPRLSGWFAVTKAAERLCGMRRDDRQSYLLSLAHGVLPPSSARPTLRHDVTDAPAEPIAKLTERLRLEAEDMERAGCYEMAFATVSAACRLSRESDVVSQLTATAHLGRIARQLGDSGAATDCYEAVVAEATRVRDGPLQALGILGLGNLARSRGNRPEERRLFNVALALAHPGGTCETSARLGMMTLLLSEHRLPEALDHGWRAFDLTASDSDERATIVSNIAFAALHADFAGAALSGFLHVLTLTRVLRIRLPAIGGGMRAAASRNEIPVVERLGSIGDEEASRANIPFVVAGYALNAGLAWLRVRAWDDATSLLGLARSIGDERDFHEIVANADQALVEVQARQSRHEVLRVVETPPRRREEPVPEGIRRLETLAV